MANVIVNEITDELNQTVKRALHRLTVEARSASNVATDAARDAGSTAREGASIARHAIRDHPGRSVALGVAIGALAALLLTWRRGRSKH